MKTIIMRKLKAIAESGLIFPINKPITLVFFIISLRIMPNHEEHCEHSFKRYRIRGDDIHKFLDEPCRMIGQNHREFRHDTKTIKLVGEVFGQKYGRELSESIALDHITADHEEGIRKRKENILLLKCPNCGGHLEGQSDKKTCKYCGYEIETLGNFPKASQ